MCTDNTNEPEGKLVQSEKNNKLTSKAMNIFFHAIFWTISGQKWQLPVKGGNFRYSIVSPIAL